MRRENLAYRRKREAADSPRLAPDLATLGRNLLKQVRASEAEPLLRECLAIHANATPDVWQRYNAMSLLGGAVLGQSRYAEAEPLVVGGYAGLEARVARIPAAAKYTLTEAAERVVRLYRAWGKPDKAQAWAKRLGLADLPSDVFARP